MKKVAALILAIVLFDLAVLLLGAVEVVRNPQFRDWVTKYAALKPYDQADKPVYENNR